MAYSGHRDNRFNRFLHGLESDYDTGVGANTWAVLAVDPTMESLRVSFCAVQSTRLITLYEERELGGVDNLNIGQTTTSLGTFLHGLRPAAMQLRPRLHMQLAPLAKALPRSLPSRPPPRLVLPTYSLPCSLWPRFSTWPPHLLPCSLRPRPYPRSKPLPTRLPFSLRSQAFLGRRL